MPQEPTHTMEPSQWSSRERELLRATLQVLREQGYSGLTLDAIAATAHASKSTVYRHWPSRAELVLAAFVESVRQIAHAPQTGSLRGDLQQLGNTICEQASTHAATMRAMAMEMARNPALNDVVQQQFIEQTRRLIGHVLNQAADRGEIEAVAITDDLWDLMSGYLIFRAIWSVRPPTRRTVQALVDDVIIPSLARGAQC